MTVKLVSKKRMYGDTLYLKKVSTYKLSLTLSNLNRFQNVCTAGKRMKFATNLCDTTHLTL